MTRRPALAALALATAGWCPLERDGVPVAWPADAWPLPLGDGPLAWRAAAAQWSGSAGATFLPAGAPPDPMPDGTVAFAAVEATADWLTLTASPGAVAFTVLTHEGGTLLDADVLLNAAEQRFSDEAEPRAWHRPTVLAHELGHVLGLGHADAGCGQAGAGPLMVTRLSAGAVVEPGQDDVTGAAAVVAPPTGPAPRLDLTATPDGYLVDPGVPLSFARLWAPTPALLEPAAPLAVAVAVESPATLELWSTAGRGLVAALPARPAPPLAGEPAAPADGGCHQAPRVLFFPLMLLPFRRKSRCVSRPS